MGGICPTNFDRGLAVGLVGSVAVHGIILGVFGAARFGGPPAIPVEIVDLVAAAPGGSVEPPRVEPRRAPSTRASAPAPLPRPAAPAPPAPPPLQGVVAPLPPVVSAPEPSLVMEEPPAKAPPAPAVVAIAEPVPAPAAVPAPPDRTELWGSPGTMREAAASRLASLPRSDTAGREAGTLLASNTPSGAVPAGPALAGGSPAAASAAGLTAPRLAFKQPRYPEAARQAGIEGTVLVKAYVLVDGSVKDAQVKRSGGYSALDRAALDTILESRFIPARRGGTPVAVWVEVPVDFKLSD